MYLTKNEIEIIRKHLQVTRYLHGQKEGDRVKNIIDAVRPIAVMIFAFETKEELEYARAHITELVYPVVQEDGYEMCFDFGKCRHCNACVTACAYAARSFDEGGFAQVDEALCRHCGLCVSVCSFGALNLSKGQVI